MIANDALGLVERRRALGAAASSHGLSVSVIRTRAALEALAPRWQGLEEQCGTALLFQSLGWARAMFDFEAKRGNDAFDPVIATIEDGRRLVALLPLERVGTGARTLLVPLGHAFAQIADVLVAPEADAVAAVGQLLAGAIAAAPSDAVSLLKVRDGSVLARGMPKTHILTGAAQGAPYVALDAFPDFASYFSTVRVKTRKNMRNARNRLERDGAVTHHVAQNAGETLGVIERTLSGRADRLRDQGLTSRAFRDAAFTTFCRGMAQRADLPVMAMSLRHNDEPIAEQWGFVHKQRYYAFVASRDFSNSDESPGKLHLGEVIHACAEHGLHGADLMVPVMPYKLTWATEVVTVRDYALPVTPRGLLVLHAWDRTLRPLFKKTLLNMPRGLRSFAMKLLGRSL